MAIYRPPKPRWPLAIATAVAGIVVGLVAGLVIGNDEFDATESAQQIKTILISAAGSLEVAAVEYQESVVDGEVVKQTEFDGALDAVASSRSQFSEARPALESLFPAQLEPIEDLYDEVEQAMESHASPDIVAPLLERLEELLKGETG